MKIKMFDTYIHPSAYKRVKSVLDSTYVNEGYVVKEFENRLSHELGLKNPVTTNSCTSALHLALVLSCVHPGDEVICPAQTFIATGSVIFQEHAKPVFADIQYETGNIDPKSIEKKITKKTKAIIVVHWGGYPCDLDEINEIARKKDIYVIEDAAHALGATYKGKPVGSISDFTCFSFQAIKHLTTGDGGALCCKDVGMYREALKRRWFGIDKAKSKPSILGEREYDVDRIGYKYHMNDYAAALGLANLKNFKTRLNRRRIIAMRYRSTLGELTGINLFKYSLDKESAYWLFGFHVKNREAFIIDMKNKGIETSVVHQGIDRNSIFGGINKDLKNQRNFDKTQTHIPIHDTITDKNIRFIIKTIQKSC